MGSLICPKCGFQQDEAPQCMRCGIIFERYKPRSQRPFFARSDSPSLSRAELLKRAWRVFRWVSLGITAIVVLLILRKSSPPRLDSAPDTTLQAEIKMQRFEESIRARRPDTLRYNEGEVNAWMQSNLALAPKPSADPALTETDSEAIAQARAMIRDIKIDLDDDQIRAYTLFDFHGKDLSLTLKGRLVVQNGYLRVQLTGGKLGSLPLPQSVLDAVGEKLFSSPENKEKFRLSPAIRDIRVDNSELVVTSR